MRYQSIAVMLLVLLLGCAASSQATLLQSRFGVNPTLTYVSNWEYQTGQYYSFYHFDASSLAPTLNTSTADYEVNDWYGWTDPNTIEGHVNYNGGTWPSGSEPYDVEAVYFDDDGRNMYIAIITSYPSPTTGIYVETREGANIPVTQGDLAFDMGMTGSQQDNAGFKYNYGVDLTDENRPGTGNVTTLASNTVGTGLYRTTGSGLITGAWYTGTPNGAVSPPNDQARTNFDPSYSPTYVDYKGAVSTSWYKLDLFYGGNPVQENGYDTWVIEAVVPLSYFPRFEAGHSISYQWLMGCRNDGNNDDLYMDLDGDLDMPEPGTYALLALGVAAIGFRRRWGKRS